MNATASPDAWDECGACGHDRDDHHGGRGGTACQAPHWPLPCPCSAFEEPA